MQGNITDWGKEVKKGLIERGWSINDLAERIGKSRTRVSGVVNGRIYSDSIASAISDLLNIEKAEKLMKEFEVAAEPIKHFLAEHYDPMCTAVISMDNIQIFRGELGEPIQNICCRCGAEVEEEMKG